MILSLDSNSHSSISSYGSLRPIETWLGWENMGNEEVYTCPNYAIECSARSL